MNLLHNQFQLLTKRYFLPLFLTQFFGAFNDNVFKSALIVLITFKLVTNADHAQMLINLAGAVFILPFFLFSATAGQLADKLDRIKIIRIIKTFEIALMLTGALSFYWENIPLMMLTLFFLGTHSAFFGPIKYSALPDLLQPGELLAGNGLIEASTFMAILIGTILGTTLSVNTQGALLAVFIGILVALLGLMSSFFIPKIVIAEPSLKVNWYFIAETWQLIRQVKKNRVVFRVILAISWFWFMGFIFVIQFPIYTKDILHGNQYIVTLFLVMFSVGIAVGSLLCNFLLKGIVQLKYVPAGIWGMSIFTLDFCWAGYGVTFLSAEPLRGVIEFLSTFSGIRMTLDLFLLCVCGGFYAVPLYATIQTKSDVSIRSRVIACNNIFGAIFMVAAALLVMLLVTLGCSAVQVFVIMAIANIAVGIWVCCSLLNGFKYVH